MIAQRGQKNGRHEMFRIERAVLLAAGRGKRLRPWTDETPKPLLEVQGRPLIERLIERLLSIGLREIYIVIGYRAEQFSYLAERFPEVQLVCNPLYDQANNILSLYAVRMHLENCIILDSDQMLRDGFELPMEFEKSCYCCTWTEQPTKEWLLTVENHHVVNCSFGGNYGWQLFSISFWNAADGKRLAHHLEEAYNTPDFWPFYWDDIALTLHPEAYDLDIFPVQMGDILEFDSVRDLATIDSHYEVHHDA